QAGRRRHAAHAAGVRHDGRGGVHGRHAAGGVLADPGPGDGEAGGPVELRPGGGGDRQGREGAGAARGAGPGGGGAGGAARRRRLGEAKTAWDAEDYGKAYQDAQRAVRPLRILMRAEWEAATKSLGPDAPPTASPYAVSFYTLPKHWRFRQQLGACTP